MTRIASAKYLAGSKGETCKLRIAGVPCSGTETVVPCHVRDSHTGRSIKASDISVIDGCFVHHEIFDRRAKLPNGEYLSEEEWLFYALRGIQETLEARIARGLLIVPRDPERLSSERPTPPRKPREKRAKVPHNPVRKIQSRNTLRKRLEST